jgi:hypothetical protein
VAAGLVAAAAAAGCGGGDEPAASDPKPTPDAVQAALDEAAAGPPDVKGDDETKLNKLLRERAALLQRGAAGKLAATSKGPQQGRDRRAARRTARLGLSHVTFTPQELTSAGRRATVKASLAYRVRGMRRPFRNDRRISARRTADGWKVTSDRARRDKLPWEVAAFRAVRTRHVVLLAPVGLDVGELRPGLERAYRSIRRDLPRRDLPRSVVVIATANHRQAELLAGRISQDIVALANVTAVYGSAPALPVQRVTGQRMIVIADIWSRQPPERRQGTLEHEMTHTALNPETSGRTPAWLVEGVAMFVEGDDRSAEPQARLRHISRPNSIFRLDGAPQSAGYAAASAAVREIVDRRGTKGLFRLYEAFNDPEIPGRPGPRTVDRVMRRTLDLSLAELQAAIG